MFYVSCFTRQDFYDLWTFGRALVKYGGAGYFKTLLDQGDVTTLANLAVAWASIFCIPLPPFFFSLKLKWLSLALLFVAWSLIDIRPNIINCRVTEVVLR